MTQRPPNNLSPLPVDEWDASLGHVAADMDGAPINVHKMLAHHPDLLKAWWNFRNHSVRGGALGDRLGELVILRVGVSLGAWYEWGSHVDRALKTGLLLEEINRVLAPQIGPEWPDAEAALLRTVDHLLAHRQLSPALRVELERHFTTPQILDIIAIHGMYLILACVVNTWDTPLDEAITERIEPHTTAEGFAISAAKFHTAAD